MFQEIFMKFLYYMILTYFIGANCLAIMVFHLSILGLLGDKLLNNTKQFLTKMQNNPWWLNVLLCLLIPFLVPIGILIGLFINTIKSLRQIWRKCG